MILILILLTLQLFFPHPSFALTPTPQSPSPTPTESSSNLDEIQKIRKAVQDKVKEKLDEIVSSENKKKGILGIITVIDNVNITISYQDTEKNIITDENTIIVDINRKQITTAKLKVGQSILAMGYENADKALEAKRVVVNDPNYLPVKKVITIGKIVDRSQTSDVATLIPSNNKNNQYQIVFTAKTIVTNPSGKKLALKDIITGKKAIVVLTPDTKSKSLTANTVYLLD